MLMQSDLLIYEAGNDRINTRKSECGHLPFECKVC